MDNCLLSIHFALKIIEKMRLNMLHFLKKNKNYTNLKCISRSFKLEQNYKLFIYLGKICLF